MLKPTKDIIFIPKSIFEDWQTANDPDFTFAAALSNDGAGYFINVKATNQQEKARLEELIGFAKIQRVDWDNWVANNPPIFQGDDEIHNETFVRGVPFHPTMQDVHEYEWLFNGSKATLLYNPDGDSTWTFPISTLTNGLADVILDDDFIRVPLTAFGPVLPALQESRFINLDGVNIMMHTWPLVTKVLDGDNVIVTITIPPPPPPQ